MRNLKQTVIKIGCRNLIHLGLGLFRAFVSASNTVALLLVSCSLLAVGGLPAWGETYSIDWSTIAAGGGTSTGGVYSVSGTIGQAAASGATTTGGNYALAGGFWPGLVVPSTTGAPTLFIQVSGNSVIISWSPTTPGFVLEETTSLASPSWSPAPSGNPTGPIPATGEATFYRLRQQ